MGGIFENSGFLVYLLQLPDNASEDTSNPENLKSNSRKISSTTSSVEVPDFSKPDGHVKYRYTIYTETWLINRNHPDSNVLWTVMEKVNLIRIKRDMIDVRTGEVLETEIRFPGEIGMGLTEKNVGAAFNAGSGSLTPYIRNNAIGDTMRLWFWENNFNPGTDRVVDSHFTSDFQNTNVTFGVTINLDDSTPTGGKKDDSGPPPEVVTEHRDTPVGQPNLLQAVTLPGLQYRGRDTETRIDNEYAVVPRTTTTSSSWVVANTSIYEGGLLTGSQINSLCATQYPPNQKFLVETIRIATNTEAAPVAARYPSATVVGYNKLWLPMEFYTVEFKPLQE